MTGLRECLFLSFPIYLSIYSDPSQRPRDEVQLGQNCIQLVEREKWIFSEVPLLQRENINTQKSQLWWCLANLLSSALKMATVWLWIGWSCRLSVGRSHFIPQFLMGGCRESGQRLGGQRGWTERQQEFLLDTWAQAACRIPWSSHKNVISCPVRFTLTFLQQGEHVTIS